MDSKSKGTSLEQMLRKMFWCGLIFCMQFSKTSKKTRKIAEETAALPDTATQSESSNPRTTRSSKSKSTETLHKAATKSLSSEQATPAAEPKTMAAAAGASLNPETAVTEQSVKQPVITQQEIAQLAYSYWVARGYTPGSPEQDWLRAERELTAKL